MIRFVFSLRTGMAGYYHIRCLICLRVYGVEDQIDRWRGGGIYQAMPALLECGLNYSCSWTAISLDARICRGRAWESRFS